MKKHLRTGNAADKEHYVDHKKKLMNEKMGALIQGLLKKLASKVYNDSVQ